MWFYSFLRPVRLERLSKFYHLAVAGTRKSAFTMSYARCPQGDLICLIVSNVMQYIGLVFESFLLSSRITQVYYILMERYSPR